MRRFTKSWLFAGMSLLAIPGPNLVYGQASPQSLTPAPAATPAPVASPQSAGDSKATEVPFPRSSQAFPKGYQAPAATPAPMASPQSAGDSKARGIPFPQSSQAFPKGYQAPVGGKSMPTRLGTTSSGVPAPVAFPQSTTAFPRGGQPLGNNVVSSSAQSMIAPPVSSQAAMPMSASKPLSSAQTIAGPAGISGGLAGQPMTYGVGPMTAPYTGAGYPGPGVTSGMGGAAGGPGGAGGTTAPGATTPGATAPGATTPGGAAAAGAGDLAALTDGIAADLGGPSLLGAGSSLAPNMIGDLSPLYSGTANAVSTPVHSALGHAPPPPSGLHGVGLPYPTVRNFKISENQSPKPQDRVFFDFNYYNNVNGAVNAVDQTHVDHMKAYTYMWGFEKTFDNGNGSFGMRLPLNTLTADSNPIGAVSTPTSSALGNLDLFAKYILKQNTQTGSLITAGFALTPQTATTRFAGAPYVQSLNTTYFQPFIAYLWRADRLYVQGFSGFDFPANNADVTLMYNDIGLGYFVYRDEDRSHFLTAIAPTFEVHVNSPFNHRNPFNVYDPAASATVCNLTYGVNVLFYGRSMLTAALVTPVTSPKPFDTECALYFNWFYGRTYRGQQPIQPPVIQ
jgi:hypothetical protein